MISESPAFHTAVFDALCACLGLDSHSAEAAALIHEACAEPENVPRPPRNRNVIYWTVLTDPAPDPAAAAYVTEAGGAGRNMAVVYTTLKYQLIIVCYGPACEQNALRIRHMLFPDGAGSPRQIFRSAGIFPVPDPPQPSLLHEEEGSLWRKRADLTISLRVRCEQAAPARNSIRPAPAVVIFLQAK
ncbi:MAG: hypothetical protein K6F61_03925 [Clostridiales bacterium]|nr:hypothetical protein [Clostridiales bacterium]